MGDRQLDKVVKYLHKTVNPRRDPGGLADADLLNRWIENRDEAAFELLLHRHTPMILGVCRRVLRVAQDVEDASQATLLALVRHGRSIGRREMVGTWLYRVACRMALRVASNSARHATFDPQVVELSARNDDQEIVWRDLRPVLDAEIDRLPQKLRAAFLLCHLEGRSNAEAARELGCPVGTVLSRLHRARERLRTQLARRGLGVPVAAVSVALAGDLAAATTQARVIGAVVRTALALGAGASVAEVIPSHINKLIDLAMRGTLLTAKKGIALVLAVTLFGAGGGFVVYPFLTGAQPIPAEKKAPRPTANAAAVPPKKASLVWFDEKTRKAIDRGIQFLKEQERGRGSWEADVEGKIAERSGGWTSLALLALLNSGVPVDDPALKRGLEYLRTIPPKQTYIVALQTAVFARAGQQVDRERIQRNVDWLLRARRPKGWTYNMPAFKRPPAGLIDDSSLCDNSNTQYALLGLHEGLLAGARVPRKDLEAIREFYLATQRDGGWGYRAGHPPNTMTMTAGGLCGLAITDWHAGEPGQQLDALGKTRNCGVYRDAQAVGDAWKWIGDRLPSPLDDRTVSVLGAQFYCLRDLGRAGQLTGQRFFGGKDWYRIGSIYLLRTQKADGSWVGSRPFDFWPVVATSFSLLFLAQQPAPVLVKLAHNDGNGWNNKRSDMRHLAAFAGPNLIKKPSLGWQLYDIRPLGALADEELTARARELHSAPLVFFNGHDKAPAGQEKELLKRYLAFGGLIFAEACCGDQRFDRSFRKLARDLFPDSPLRELRADHPIWTASGKFASKAGAPFKLYGIDRGGRTVVIYSPAPLTGYWEANQYQDARGQAAFELGTNVIAYAMSRSRPADAQPGRP